MLGRLLTVAAIVAAALGYAFLDRDTGVSTLLQLRAEVAQGRAESDALRDRIDSLRADARALESDPFAIERAIREDLGLGRPDDVVVRFPRSESSSH
ncbi:MAG: septum formation initiator family protein [Deltaproteobacteria bacterium]|nr:MAG: septum formation initiator family protein [Deltaproteobacteria bacterium]